MRDFTAVRIPAEGQALGHTKSRQQGRMLRHNKRAELLAAICVATLFTIGAAAMYCAGLLDSKVFFDNTMLDNVPVGGMTKAEAMQRFADLNATTPAPVQVQVGDRTWNVTAENIDARYSVAETIETAWNFGRKGTLLQKLGDIFSLRSAQKNFAFSVIYEEDKLQQVASRIAAEASTAPVNASIDFRPDANAAFTIKDEVNGNVVDPKDLCAQMRQKLGNRVDTKIVVQTKAQPPEITASMLRQQTQTIGSCTTVLTEDPIRNANIKVAAAAVNGYVLPPGQVLSFNTLTGERTEDKGYSDAPAISGGKLVNEVGGGICQVSSTVYDAALLAGLEVVERHPHTWPMYYVREGLDAMVDFGTQKDLKLKNNSKVNVYLVVRVDTAKRTVTAEFFGQPTSDTISIEQKDYQVITPQKPIEVPNASKPIGWSNVTEEERKGYRVSIYRVFTSGGDTRQELLYNDYYPPVQGKVEIGTKSPSSHNK